ncbi:chromate transporter [uncultured Pseudoramibacter sp.]|uniref:chromate transporter n=1 Tax=uncultured Pseudoramibacter sp. TaxID=1623493 RepID=UPI0025F1412E|nr:chromate transporter [uncultured Pseudoramibacter sp.]
MVYIRLFWEFFKTGLFAIGGGMATFPFLSNIGQTTHWYTQSQLADMVAVSESTPGPLGINMATYVGFTVSGVWGAIVSTLSEVLPSVIIITLIAKVLQTFKDNQYVQDGFYGLRPASTALIAAACCSVGEIALFNTHTHLSIQNFLSFINWKAVAFAVVIFVLSNWVPKVKNWHPIIFIAIAAAVGIVVKF